jgi:alkyl hydroperoxide reductase subunit AhpC
MKSFGVFDKASGGVTRSYFIIDKKGLVRFKSVRSSNLEQDLLSTDELLKEVKKINKG